MRRRVHRGIGGRTKSASATVAVTLFAGIAAGALLAGFSR